MPMGLGHRPARAKKIHNVEGERFRIAAAAWGGRAMVCRWLLVVDVFSLALAS